MFEDFEPWLAKVTGMRVHGHLFAPDRVAFAGGEAVMNGGLTNHVGLRDYNPTAFLSNLIWNTRGERQCFQYGPADNQEINWFLARDINAQISVVTGAWAVPLFRSGRSFSEIRKEAARLQRIETEQLEILRSTWTKARVRIWTMAEFVEAPMEPIQTVIDEILPTNSPPLSQAPTPVDLRGFGKFLQTLKNQGMHPHLMGDYPVEDHNEPAPRPILKPYLVH